MSKSIAEEFLRDMEQMASTIIQTLGVKADYTLESLEQLEQQLDRMFPPGHEPMPTTVLVLGYYLGETIVQNVPNARWVTEGAKHPYELTIEIEQFNEGKGQVFPFNRIYKFFEDHENGLAAFYRIVHLMSVGGIDVKNMKEGKWVEFPNGDCVRIVKEFYKRMI